MLSRILRTTAATAAFAMAAVPAVASAQFAAPVQANFDAGPFFLQITGRGQGNGFIGNGGTFKTTNNVTTLAVIDRFFCTDDQNGFVDPMNGAWITALWGNTDMSKTQLFTEMGTNAAARTRYLENANFANQIRLIGDANGNDNVGYDVSNDATVKSLQYKIWDGAKSPWTQQVGAANIADARGWFVVSGLNANNGNFQELLVYSKQFANTNTTVPEPSTYALMLPAMFGVAYMARRRRKVVA